MSTGYWSGSYAWNITVASIKISTGTLFVGLTQATVQIWHTSTRLIYDKTINVDTQYNPNATRDSDAQFNDPTQDTERYNVTIDVQYVDGVLTKKLAYQKTFNITEALFGTSYIGEVKSTVLTAKDPDRNITTTVTIKVTVTDLPFWVSFNQNGIREIATNDIGTLRIPYTWFNNQFRFYYFN